jgi:hypothetical protein
MDEFFRDMRVENEGRVSSIETSILMNMGNKKKRKKEKNWRKNKKKDEKKVKGKEEKNDGGKKRKKRKRDNFGEIRDDKWTVRKRIKRSKTEAEDIRRYFRTEDKH